MPVKGHSQTEETKKKISEALKKDGTDNTESVVKRSKEAQKMYDDYTASIGVSDDLKGKRDALQATLTGMKRGKATTAQRKAIRAKMAEIQKTLKAEQQKRMAIRKQAEAMKRVRHAELYIAKAQIRNQQINDLERRAEEKIAKAKTPEIKKNYQNIIARAKEVRDTIKNNLDKAQATIKSKGEEKVTGANAFNFGECNHQIEHLEDLPYKPFRSLTMQEKRCNFEYLNEEFNNLQKELEKELIDLADTDIDRFIESSKKKIDAMDVATIAALLLLIRGKVKKALDNKLVQAYEAGKKTAAGELQVERPTTPLMQTQIKNLDVSDITEGYISNIERTGKSNIKNALVVGAATAAIMTTTRDKMKAEAVKEAQNIAGTLIGQYINRGRKQVFEQNIKRITSFQRSEILDFHTCEMCISLDKMVVSADDPMAQMDIVHSNCRGVWIPIFVIDEEKPEVTGIPSSILDSFELIDGRPVVNSFKQLKKPIKK